MASWMRLQASAARAWTDKQPRAARTRRLAAAAEEAAVRGGRWKTRTNRQAELEDKQA